VLPGIGGISRGKVIHVKVLIRLQNMLLIQKVIVLWTGVFMDMKKKMVFVL
jgi:hypothetical protein